MARLTHRSLAVVAVLATLSFLVAACGGGPAHNSVANLSKGKTTTTSQSSSPAATGGGGGGQASSGGGPPAGGQMSMSIGGSYSQDLKFAECMRSHGMPDFPDPSANGTFSLNVGPNSPQFQTAQKACRKYMPKGAQPSPAEQAKMLAQALKFSQCMRAHGITDFPDPQSTNGGISIKIGGPSGSSSSNLNPNNPQFQAAQSACQGLMPGPKGGPK